MNKNKIEAVIFDMDGLLLDTEKISKEQWQRTGMELGYPIPDEVFMAIVGTNKEGARKITMERLPGFPYDESNELYYKYINEYYESNEIPVKAGAVELLEFLCKKGIKRAVGTSTAQNRAFANLTKAKLIDYFDVRVYGDMVQNGKPAPDIFLKAANELGVSPKGCVVLEDSKNGIIAASRAGMMPVMIPDMIVPDEETEKLLFAKYDSLLQAAQLFSF